MESIILALKHNDDNVDVDVYTLSVYNFLYLISCLLLLLLLGFISISTTRTVWLAA